jgi:hypothetical protein
MYGYGMPRQISQTFFKNPPVRQIMSDSTDTIDLPYLRHLKWDETVVITGDRKTPTLLYVTRAQKMIL